MNELCPHGRHKGAVCIPCAEELEKPAREEVKKPMQPSGLDAEYYDFPEWIRTAQDLIEWLNLDFANGNVLKSLIRENNPNVSKETESLYEAEKRFYFTSRHLNKVRKMQK